MHCHVGSENIRVNSDHYIAVAAAFITLFGCYCLLTAEALNLIDILVYLISHKFSHKSHFQVIYVICVCRMCDCIFSLCRLSGFGMSIQCGWLENSF